MSSENIRNLVRFRLDQADAALRAARVLLDQDLFRDAVNRSYYAMFYAVLALLVTKQIGTSKHQGAISMFDREFVRTGVFHRELSYWLHEAFEMRLDADYAEMVEVPEEDARRILSNAVTFIGQVKNYLSGSATDPGGTQASENHC
jgi:uncharacterized protein (UPF0332 family)